MKVSLRAQSSARFPGFGPTGFVLAALLLQASCDDGHKVETPRAAEPKTPAEIAAKIASRFIQLVDSRAPDGPKKKTRRAVFLKPHGCARGTFKVADQADLPPEFRVGLFATPGITKPMRARFSADNVPMSSDLDNNTIGFAIKVLEVPEQKILMGEENFTTQDFLLQNHSEFFVDTARDFMLFNESIFAGKLKKYLAEHKTTKDILDAMHHEVANVLNIRYFSTTPYQFGEGNHVKYSARPCMEGPVEEKPTPEQVNYLRTRLDRDMQQGGACFLFQVQLRKGEMPLDAATVPWSEVESPPQTVATIWFSEPQDINALDDECDDWSFTAWHALPAHRPVGSINEARGVVYKMLADLRRGRNMVPIAEPKASAEELQNVAQ